MIGAQSRIFIVHIHMSVGVIDFAYLPLLICLERRGLATRFRERRKSGGFFGLRRDGIFRSVARGLRARIRVSLRTRHGGSGEKYQQQGESDGSAETLQDGYDRHRVVRNKIS
jgi:hypothetical protein